MTVGSESLRLDRIEVSNFRCFERCEVDLHPRLTVLVAENGHGKTAVLDAIGVALRPLIAALAGVQRDGHGLWPSDVRLRRENGAMEPALPMQVGAEGWVGGAWCSWKRTARTFNARYVRATHTEVLSLVAAGERLHRAAASKTSAKPLPLVASFGLDRMRREPGTRRPNASVGRERFDVYVESGSASSSHDELADWYEAMVDAAQSPTSVMHEDHVSPEQLLAAVRAAVATVLEPTQWTSVAWEPDSRDVPGHLVVEHPENGRLPLSSLSGGVSNMVALVGTLAHWCVRLNPQLGIAAAKRTPGLLLIDEVELHLHPSWQQRIVELLQRAFPAMQLVITTHSPHVLSTVDVRSIRVIRLQDGVGWLETPEFQTKGVESSDVLAQIMGVDPVPRVKESQDLHEYCAMIERGLGGTNDAVALRRKLERHFGAQHPVMIDCDRLLHFQRFKRERATRKTT